MSKLVMLATGAAAAMLIAGSAYAADLPSRKGPPPAVYAPAPIFTWTGFYVGLNAGVGINANSSQLGPLMNSSGQSDPAFTGGGQIGYNWQTGAMVLGLETDINYLGASNSDSGSMFGGNGSSAGYLGTVRGRVGYAMDRFMIYATGGLAYGSSNTPSSMAGLDAFGAPHLLSNMGGTSTSVGFTIGGGVEYALSQNWSIKAEYLYVDLGSTTANYYDALSGALVPSTMGNREHIIRAGVNYRFNSGMSAPVFAKY